MFSALIKTRATLNLNLASQQRLRFIASKREWSSFLVASQCITAWVHLQKELAPNALVRGLSAPITMCFCPWIFFPESIDLKFKTNVNRAFYCKLKKKHWNKRIQTGIKPFCEPITFDLSSLTGIVKSLFLIPVIETKVGDFVHKIKISISATVSKTNLFI